MIILGGYIIDMLRGINGLFGEESIAAASKAETSSEVLKMWEDFKAYKGIIQCAIDEKAELKEARDEKYAHCACGLRRGGTGFCPVG